MHIRQKFLLFMYLGLMGLVLPTTAHAKKPVIIYFTDYEGPNIFVKNEVSQLEKMGIEVFVIDLLGQFKGLDLAARQFQWTRLNQTQALSQIQKVINDLKARKDRDLDISRVGIIAESEASGFAIRLASENPSFRAVVLRNPSLVFDKEKFDSIKSKFLLVLAQKKYDPKRLETFKDQLNQAHIQYEIVLSQSGDRFYDLSQAKRYIASDAETYKSQFYEFIKRFVTLEVAKKY